MSRRYYSGDPYWITLRYPGTCAGCGASIPKGADAFRYKSGKLYGKPCHCGTAESERFEELARDEAMYGGGY